MAIVTKCKQCEKHKKICAFCGKEFLPKSNFQKYCKGPHIRICPVCGKEYEETNSDNLKRPPHACSYECRAKKTRQTSLERYGCVAPGNNEDARKKAKATMQERFGVDYAMQSETIRKKSVATNIKKYGVENPQQNESIKQKTIKTNRERYSGTGFQSEELLNKYKDTMIDIYGVTSPIQSQQIRQDIMNTMQDRHGAPWFSQSEEYKDKCHTTSLAKYGAEHWMQTDECKQKCKDTWLRNYGVDNPSKSPIVIAKIKQAFIDKYGTDGLLNVAEIREKIQKTCMERYGVPYGVLTPQAQKHNGAISNQNKQVMKLLDDAGLSYQSEFNLENKSFDIKILYSNILIEIDPSYTHSIELTHWNTSVSDTYHIKKTMLANKHGYQCYHIFDWDDRKKFIKSLTKKKDIEIDQYYISEVDELTASEFYCKYSIYIPDTKYAIHIGLFSKKNNMLLQVSSFRFIDISNCRWQLCANSTKFQINVINGLQSIIDHFVKYYDPAEIIALCDLAKSNGSMFESCGFKELSKEPPRLIWSRYRAAISNDNVKNQTKLSDEQIYSMMINNKYLPVYDCGYKVYSLKLR